jgi:hypothetical protein
MNGTAGEYGTAPVNGGTTDRVFRGVRTERRSCEEFGAGEKRGLNSHSCWPSEFVLLC